MGVDFYVCSECESTFPDCGEYKYCYFCNKKFGPCCMDKYNILGEGDLTEEGEIPEGETNGCPFCSMAIVSDEDLLEFALERLGVDRKTLEADYRSGALDKSKPM